MGVNWAAVLGTALVGEWGSAKLATTAASYAIATRSAAAGTALCAAATQATKLPYAFGFKLA